MKIQELLEIINNILDDASSIIELKESDTISDKWDSLAQVNLLVTIESTYGIKFTMKQIIGMHTVGDIINATNEHLENK